MSVINIQEKFALFSDHWSPKKVGELNGQQILLAKLKANLFFINTTMKMSFLW